MLRKLEEETFGFENYAFTREEEVIVAEYLLVFIVLLCVTLLLQFHVGRVWHWHYLPESGATMLLGMAISLIIRLAGKDTNSGEGGVGMLGFSPTVFFLGFLPPIIYNSGYQLKRRLFFANLGGIMSLAIIGTTFSALFIGLILYGLGQGGAALNMSFMEYLCFGSLISATDPVSTLAVFTELRVDPTLFYIVFGESVMNDAVGITLFRTTAKFVGITMTAEDGIIAFCDFCISLIASTIIGYVLGLASAYMFKVFDMSEHRIGLIAIFVCQVYIPFFFSEVLQLSGIVTILFTAIVARRYTNFNIPPECRRAAAFVFELLAYMSETSVFLYLGIDVFSKSKQSDYRMDIVFWTILWMIIARACHVYPLLHLVNNYREKRAKQKGRRPNLIPMKTMHMTCFAGLRGAVAYACANIFPDDKGHRNVIITSTMMIAILTIFINGGLTINALKFFNIETGVDFTPYVESLKKVAKPYKFLVWEQKYIYPYVIRGYHGEIDISSHGGPGGGDAHLGDSVHLTDTGAHHSLPHGTHADVEANNEEDNSPAHGTGQDKRVALPTTDDADEEEGDGIQLAKGFANSSGPTVKNLLHENNDSLW